MRIARPLHIGHARQGLVGNLPAMAVRQFLRQRGGLLGIEGWERAAGASAAAPQGRRCRRDPAVRRSTRLRSAGTIGNPARNAASAIGAYIDQSGQPRSFQPTAAPRPAASCGLLFQRVRRGPAPDRHQASPWRSPDGGRARRAHRSSRPGAGGDRDCRAFRRAARNRARPAMSAICAGVISVRVGHLHDAARKRVIAPQRGGRRRLRG